VQHHHGNHLDSISIVDSRNDRERIRPQHYRDNNDHGPSLRHIDEAYQVPLSSISLSHRNTVSGPFNGVDGRHSQLSQVTQLGSPLFGPSSTLPVAWDKQRLRDTKGTVEGSFNTNRSIPIFSSNSLNMESSFGSVTDSSNTAEYLSLDPQRSLYIQGLDRLLPPTTGDLLPPKRVLPFGKKLEKSVADLSHKSNFSANILQKNNAAPSPSVRDTDNLVTSDLPFAEPKKTKQSLRTKSLLKVSITDASQLVSAPQLFEPKRSMRRDVCTFAENE
jgi:hypothetical protein